MPTSQPPLRLDTARQHLLWFRPVSPLHYQLPAELARLPWAQQTHLPIEQLSPLALSQHALQALQSSEAWFLSSPTAAHCLAIALRQAEPALAPQAMAVVGQASWQAWLAAGGRAVDALAVSDTGESMGLLAALRRYPNVCIVRAQTGREDLPAALRAAGANVHRVAAYQKTAIPAFADLLNASLQGNALNKVLCFTSTEQVRALVLAVQAPDALRGAPFWASHERVAQAALAAGFKPLLF